MNQLKVRNSLLLFVAAFIWGTAFVAQSVGMDYIEPFTFSTLRSLIGSAFLVPCIWLLGKRKQTGNRKEEDKKELLKGGIACGVVIFTAANLQQVAMLYTSVGKSGFLTALYIVIVLCMKTGSLKLEFGDILLLLSACAFSVHIMVIDHFTQRADGVKLSCIQFFVCGILSFFVMLFLEHPSADAVFRAAGPLLYVGVLSSGVAYTLQIVGQKGMNPVVASLIMSLESVISAVAGWAVLGQVLSGREMAGCVVMFLSIILAQLPEKVELSPESC